MAIRARAVFTIVAVLAFGVGQAAQARSPRRLYPPTPPGPVLESATATTSTWAFSYGGPGDDSAGVIRQLTDGSLVIGGHTTSVRAGDIWLARLDTGGAIGWQKSFGTDGNLDDGDILPTSDGGYMLAGSTQGGSVALPWLCKLDAEGNIQWQKSYQLSGVVFSSLTQLGDGTFVAVGRETTAFPMGPVSLVVARLDANGSIAWANKYASDQAVMIPIVHDPGDGTLLLTGSRMALIANGSFDTWLLKLNTATGAVMFNRTYGGPGHEMGTQVLRLADGGYLLVGIAAPSGDEDAVIGVLLLRLTADGAISWQRFYGGSGDDVGYVIPAVDGGFLLSGTTESWGAGETDLWVVKLDNAGNVQWQKTYGGAKSERGGALLDGTGGYFLFGETASFGNGNADAWVVRLNSQGNITWQRAYGGPNDEAAVPVRLNDGSVLIEGITESYGGGGEDIILLKLDTNGTIPGACPFITTTSVTPQNSSVSPVTTSLTSTTGGTTATPVSLTVASPAISSTTTALGRQELCSATGVLTATATATPTSGAAPLAVAFSGSAANGTPPYTWSWDFGDGSPLATQQNPAHTYVNPGTYQVTLTVRDATSATAVDNRVSIQVTGGGGCIVSCTGTAPTTGSAGVPVSFQATMNASGCATPPTGMWSFGDGTTSTMLNTTHTYTQTGTYDWTFYASSSSGGTPCIRTGQIVVSGTSQSIVYMIPSVAHLPGVGGTQWRSNVAVVNRNASPVNLALTYYPTSESAPLVQRSHTLVAGATVEWQDILASLFGLSAAASNKGTVHIASPLPIFATSRTYNQAPNGTYGQYYPALRVTDGIPAGQTGTIVQLKKTSVFRTNVGVQNLATTPCAVQITLHGPTGSQVGSTRTQTVAVGRFWQQDDIFGNVGAGNRDIAYARVRSTTANCPVWAYGSVVDGNTGDPTTMPVQLGSELGVHTVAAVAHAPGSGGTQWNTNTAVVNAGTAAANLGLSFLDYNQGTPPVVRTVPLAAGATTEWHDILVSLFGKSASASSKGSLQITSGQPLYVSSRTYNQAAAGTYGQYYPSVRPLQGLTSGQVGVIPHLKKTTAFRTNLGVMNVETTAVTVTIKLWAADGTQAGSTKTQTIAAGRYWQQDDIFGNVGAGNRDIAYATVEVQTAGGRVWAYGSVIDNATGDPTTIPVLF